MVGTGKGPVGLICASALAFHFIKNEEESEGSVRRKERFGWVRCCRAGVGDADAQPCTAWSAETWRRRAAAATARWGPGLGNGVPCEVVMVFGVVSRWHVAVERWPASFVLKINICHPNVKMLTSFDRESNR